VIPFGINNAVPHTSLTNQEAKRKLNLDQGTQTVLFFGRIGPYKGLELLVSAFEQIARANPQARLLIVGKPKKGAEEYLKAIQQTIGEKIDPSQVIQKIDFIPDGDTELYFKAADVLALPYTQAFQSGVLFLGYSFGLPVIASDVACFADDVLEGRTGFLFQPGDITGLAKTIETYFQSDLFRSLSANRPRIVEYAQSRHSWEQVSEMTTNVYNGFLAPSKDLRAVRQ
jgi:glycosyltransferase involved in cell wall biosynthesis